ncbi:LVIVD repeat-containing protein [Nonomuraea sp. NPDC050547]|uniref:LVIVD repeat-containing protein n=1 Tax=Nonomuraea sp. NPDC050547 TaxID=3364368 RepID=UPI003791E465
MTVRRGVLIGPLAVLLSGCLSGCAGEPPLRAAPLPVVSDTPAPTGAPIDPDILKKHDATIRHSDNLRPIAGVNNPPPFDTAAAIGTDLAFTGNHAIAGNYEGFTVYDVSAPERPVIVSQVYCPGPQNDVTVSGNLLFLSVDLPMGGASCDPGVSGRTWEGLRIFDITDKAAPKYVGAVATPCGSHTATLVSADARNVILYSSSAPSRLGGGAGAACERNKGRLTVVKVPVGDPARAAVAATPVVLDDGGTALPEPFGYGGCHDVTVFAAKKLAAASCIGDGLLLDVTDPYDPRVLDRVQDPEHFGYWHSAVFTRDGERVVFSDEFGAGRSVVCDPKTGPQLGGNGVYAIENGRLKLLGYFKIPRPQLAPKTCSAHNGSLVPARGRDMMVQGWYDGGVSVIDFTDPARAREIAYFQREKSPFDHGGSWAAYFYAGHIYSSDMIAGLDVLKLTGVPLEPALPGEFNPQTQR